MGRVWDLRALSFPGFYRLNRGIGTVQSPPRFPANRRFCYWGPPSGDQKSNFYRAHLGEAALSRVRKVNFEGELGALCTTRDKFP